jgi:hypothetical protein
VHVTKTLIRCHLQNGLHVGHPLRGQRGGRRWLLGLWAGWGRTGRRLRGLCPLSVSLPLKCLTQRLTALIPTVCSPHTLFRHVWISLRPTTSALRHSVSTLSFVRITSAILNCLCVVLMWLILAPLALEKLDFSCSISVERAFSSAGFKKMEEFLSYRPPPPTRQV